MGLSTYDYLKTPNLAMNYKSKQIQDYKSKTCNTSKDVVYSSLCVSLLFLLLSNSSFEVQRGLQCLQGLPLVLAKSQNFLYHITIPKSRVECQGKANKGKK